MSKPSEEPMNQDRKRGKGQATVRDEIFLDFAATLHIPKISVQKKISKLFFKSSLKGKDFLSTVVEKVRGHEL